MDVAILWHMHQPDYRDPRTGRPFMPWVRLHTLRGYRDMVLQTVEEDAQWTINFVPSLIDQMINYAEGAVDPHLALTRRLAADLTDEERRLIRQSFVCGNSRMIEIHSGYLDLRSRLESGVDFVAQDWLDLQVWSTLAWFGATALRDFPSLVRLQAKGRGFTESDKVEMLAIQARILGEIIDQIARVGPSRLSTSPYFHPILPLLVNTAHAHRCMDSLPDEGRFSHPEDALEQLVSARERFNEVFGFKPDGVWPSEGSVSPEVVELIARAGFKWFVSDEGVLERSDRDDQPNHGPWSLDSPVVGFFRDHGLSDRIGFQYARWDGQEAAFDLLHTIRSRYSEGGLCTLALDGENPWEAFSDAGHDFRRWLIHGLRAGMVQGVSFSEAARRAPVGHIQRLHTGSWIGANFNIWFGHADDREAWRRIAEVRERVDDFPERRDAAMQHLYAAQGSDWMWWYGDDFSTPFAAEFDELFRAHIRAAWQALGLPAPASCERPIAHVAPPTQRSPLRCLRPRWGGGRWEDWCGAGYLRFTQSAMAVGNPSLKGLDFGWTDDGDLWLRIDPGGASLESGWGLLRDDQERLELTEGVVCLRGCTDPVELVFLRRDGERDVERYPTSGSYQLAGPERSSWWV